MCYYLRKICTGDCSHLACGGSELRCDGALQRGRSCFPREVLEHICHLSNDQECPACEAHSRHYSESLWGPDHHPDGTRLAPSQSYCSFTNCVLEAKHAGPHEVPSQKCSIRGCELFMGHMRAHGTGDGSAMRELILQHDRRTTETQSLLVQMSLMVLHAMAASSTELVQDMRQTQPLTSVVHPRTRKPKMPSRPVQETSSVTNATPNDKGSSYSTTHSRLDMKNYQIRLFELYPGLDKNEVNGIFRLADLNSCPEYTALSYSWGSERNNGTIRFGNGHEIDVGRNLWRFISVQASTIVEPTLFWIDAICIDQSNVGERNHQVSLMKYIYSCAARVLVWLGDAAEDSDLAMEFLERKAANKLRTRGSGYHSPWSDREGAALHVLCERPYWKRMWIIQELLHAQTITVSCGTKHVEWRQLEALYLKLKSIEDSNWFAHHKSLMNILQSSAATMIWQRAHFRHPETPTPRLQALIGIFHEWKCTDIRDKVFALVGMSSKDFNIVPDYDMSATEVYFAVKEALEEEDEHFINLLSQILGLAGSDIDLFGQSLIDNKRPPSERLVLRARVAGTWESSVSLT